MVMPFAIGLGRFNTSEGKSAMMVLCRDGGANGMPTLGLALPLSSSVRRRRKGARECSGRKKLIG
jgi:hypothetical protein